MTSNEEVACGWCGRSFTPRARHGPTPVYCSASHRQRAYESRRFINAIPTQLTRAITAAAIPTELTRAINAAAIPTELTRAINAAAIPDELTRAPSSIAELFRHLEPPNWPEAASWPQMRGLIADTGWSLTHVPRQEVIADLLDAEPADRAGVLLHHADDIVTDCRSCLGTITDAGPTHLVDALHQALDAFDAGLPIPAQTTTASVLADVINRVFGLSFTAAATKLDKDPAEMPMKHARFWLIAVLLPRALSQFPSESEGDVPERFNRHAIAHTVDPRQYSRLNALVGLMLATGLVREIPREIADELPVADRKK